MPKTKLISGYEVDAIEGRDYLHFKAGSRKYVKRKIHKRERHIAKLQTWMEWLGMDDDDVPVAPV